MLEILTLVFTSLAIIWARKNDILEQLSEPRSRNILAKELRNPTDRLIPKLVKFRYYISFLGNQLEIFFSCLAISLALASVAFLTSIATASDATQLAQLLYSSIFHEYQRLIFGFIVVVSVVLFVIARYQSRPSLEVSANSRRVFVVSRSLIGALLLVLAVQFAYANYALSVVTLLVSGGAVLLARPGMPNRFLIRYGRASTAAGAALGVLGFMAATFAFTTTSLPENIWVLAVAIAGCAALLTYLATVYTDLASETLPQKSKSHAAVSQLGRPTMFGGFYCARAPGQFSFAVALLIFACQVLKHFAFEPVVVASTIVMQLSIFAAGATSIFGAGALAFGAMLFITFYIVIIGIISGHSIIFHEWSYVLVFWTIIPFINMLFDGSRWIVVQNTLDSVIKKQDVSLAIYLVLDVFMLCCSVGALTILGPNAIRLYNSLALAKGLTVPIPIDEYLNDAAKNFGQNGVWFGIMLAGLMVPTAINIGIVMTSGMPRLFLKRVRGACAEECEKKHLSRLEIDRLSWRISFIDSLSGILFAGAGFLGLVYLVVWLAPAVGEVLFFLAKWNLVS